MLKILKNETLFFNVRMWYIVFLLVYSVARQNITALQPVLIWEVWNIIAILLAGIIFLWHFISFKSFFKTKYIWLLVVAFAVSCISTLINIEFTFIDNVKAIANMFIQFFVLFSIGTQVPKERIKSEVRAIGVGISLLWMIAALISIFMYIFDITYTQIRYLWGDPTLINQGFVRYDDGSAVMRLWGVFVDPNLASAISLAVICFSIFILLTVKHKFVKGVAVSNIVIQLLYVILSNSRTGLLIGLTLSFVGCWYFSFSYLKRKEAFKPKKLITEVIAVLLALVAVFTYYAGNFVAKKTLPYVQYGVTKLVQICGFSDSSDLDGSMPNDTTDSDEMTDSDKLTGLDRVDIAEKGDISNGRIELWLEGFDVLKLNPVLGVGPRSYHARAATLDPDMIISARSVHNSYMELLMGSGIVGFLFVALFFVLCAKDAIIYRYKNKQHIFAVGILMLIVLSALISGMFISSLFYYLSGVSVLVFGMLGYAMAYLNDENSDNKEVI